MLPNYADIVDAVAEAQPREIAQVHGGRRITWETFGRRTDTLARSLLDHGLARQDKVAQYLYNGPEYAESFFGAVKAAMVPVNTNYRYQDRELLYLWDNADVVAVSFHGSFTERIEGLRARLPRVRLWLWVDDGTGPCPSWAVAHEDAVGGSAGGSESLALPWERSPDDLFLIYTGGTTGMPKGVMWRQGDYFRVINRERTQGPYDLSRGARGVVEQKRKEGPSGRILPACPQMHALGLMGSVAALVNGGSVVTLEGRRFDAVETFDAIDRERVNQIYVVGDVFARPLLEALDAEPARWSLESLRVVRSSGVMWSEEVKRGLLRHKPALVLRDGLGSTEAVRVGRSESTGDSTAATATFKLGPDAAVFDDDMRRVVPGSGVVGRVAVSGAVPVGYYKDPEKTAETFVMVDGERYAIPGDYALVDADGTVRAARSRLGVHQHRRREGVSGRGRGSAQAPSGRARRRLCRSAGRAVGRGDHGDGRSEKRRRRNRSTAGSGGARRLGQGRARPLQGAEARALRRRSRPRGERQARLPRVARTRDRESSALHSRRRGGARKEGWHPLAVVVVAGPLLAQRPLQHRDA